MTALNKQIHAYPDGHVIVIEMNRTYDHRAYRKDGVDDEQGFVQLRIVVARSQLVLESAIFVFHHNAK